MPGLVPESGRNSYALEPPGSEESFRRGARIETPDAPTQPASSTTQQSGGNQSHLDSFFKGSGWTRDDLILVLLIIDVATVAYYGGK